MSFLASTIRRQVRRKVRRSSPSSLFLAVEAPGIESGGRGRNEAKKSEKQHNTEQNDRVIETGISRPLPLVGRRVSLARHALAYAASAAGVLA